MQYLVLHNFRAYGKRHIKGEVVDEAEVRALHLRLAEGVLVPAVSSPAEPVQRVLAAPDEQATATLGANKVGKKPSLSFNKK